MEELKIKSTSQTLSEEALKQFEILWAKYGHVGNKAAALRFFGALLKIKITLDDLILNEFRYARHLKENPWKPKMHLSTWLNPKDKRFLDEYEEDKPKLEEDYANPKFKL